MNTHEELTKARAELASAQERLAKLEAQAKEEAAKAAAPWEPKGGDWYLRHDGSVFRGILLPEEIQAGTCYPTREAAESALPYVTFFKRLCCLAAELNPSGKVGGAFGLLAGPNGWGIEHFNSRHIHYLFETDEAAQEAAIILTRDGWKVPSL